VKEEERCWTVPMLEDPADGLISGWWTEDRLGTSLRAPSFAGDQGEVRI